MTKIKHFGISNPTKPNLKPIELVKWITPQGEIVDTEGDTLNEISSGWDNIMLMVDRHTNGNSFDVIYFYDDNYPQSGQVYFGYWNDGIIE